MLLYDDGQQLVYADGSQHAEWGGYEQQRQEHEQLVPVIRYVLHLRKMCSQGMQQDAASGVCRHSAH